MRPAHKKHVLLIEDDDDLRRMLRTYLEDEGFEVSAFEEFIEQEISEITPDLVLLDLMLPGKNGIEISQHLRQNFQGPILMITAQDNELLEVTALNEGATAYLKKPIRPHILLAHINALLRQVGNFSPVDEEANENIISVGLLTIDNEKYAAFLDDEAVPLSSAEYDLLYLLVKNCGKIISRDFILNNVRGLEYDGMNRSIDMRISTLRKKLNDSKPPYQYIKTVHGKGYIFAK